MSRAEDLTDRYGRSPLGHDVPTELERLEVLEKLADPITFSLLDRVGIDLGWRCLELGAGAGSIARWIGRRCLAGHVVATDLDIRFLTDMGDNVEVLRHDVTEDEFPDSLFDLVHARALLCHLPARQEVLQKIRRWLVPGGRVVVEEVSTFPSDSSPHPPIRSLSNCLDEYLRRVIGSDLRWARGLPGALARAGFVDLQASGSLCAIGTGGPGNALWRASIDQLSDAIIEQGLMTREEIDAAVAVVDDPTFIDFPFAFLSAVGSRPPVI